MSSLLEQAQALYERLKGASWEERKAALAEVPEAIGEAYHAYRKERMYDPENAKGDPVEHLSPSGRYKLVVTSYTSGPGTWNVTEGKVFKVDSDTPIASIRRNYSAFPYCFVEGHANGHDYLIGGEDYQGQTVIELDTGNRRELLPEEAKEGHGFCWAGYTYNAETRLLVVDGCYWACPYEFRFYDFSDPMNGWPQVEYVPLNEDRAGYVDEDGKRPTFEADGTIVTYETLYGAPDDDDPHDDETEDAEGNTVKKVQRIVATRTWRREGNQLKEVSFWVDPEEQKRRNARDEAIRKHNAWWAEYKATDPLYRKMTELCAQEPFKPADYMSQGTTYEGWCPDFKGKEARACRDIHYVGKVRVALEIAVKTGPVKLVMNSGQGESKSLFFEHSVEGVELAFAAAREFLAGVSCST